MKDRYVVYMLYSVITFVMLLIIIFKKPQENIIDYDRIIKGHQVVIDSLRGSIINIQLQNKELFIKIETIKSSIPDRRKELLQINKEIQKINELYKNSNYRDSSDVALIRRLSR
jgi:peptidoglycan hydrolase CwlO-like protein